MTVTIATLPTPPSSTDPTTFDTRADAFLTALPGVVTSQNSQNVENNSINSNVNTQVNSAMTAGLANAATNATTASTGATNASGSATAASGSATAAANSATAAQNSANAASATSGLPNMTGKGGYFMRANVGATAFELVPGGTVVRDARTTNTALAAADIGKWIDFTGTFAQTFVASATLVAGWWCRVTNTGTGTITLTPNGAELIDGAATRILYPGERRLIQCDGTTIRTVEGGTIVSRRPLFATGSSAMNAGSNLERIENLLAYPNTVQGNYSIASNGVNVVVGNAANAYSSPDGRVWTARSGITSQALIASDGSGFLAVYNGGGTLGTFYSADGITWSAATALPGGPSGYTQGNTIAGLSAGKYLVQSATSGTTYLTSNNGTAWSTQSTTPFGLARMLVSCAGLFVVAEAGSGSSYYTSSTGLAAGWTARTLPGTTTVVNMRQDFDKSLIAWGTDGTAWRSTDALTWTQLSLTLPSATNGFLSINSIVMCGATTSLGFYVLHNAKWIYRTTQLPPNVSVVKHLGLFLMAVNSATAVVLIDPTASDAATGLFD